MTLTLTVSLLGRRISDDDAQAELDALADELFDAFGGTRSVRRDELTLRCVAFNPGAVLVAGLEMPAYLADVSIDHLTC